MDPNAHTLYLIRRLADLPRGIDRVLAAVTMLTDNLTPEASTNLNEIHDWVLRHVDEQDPDGYLEHALLYDIGQLAVANILGLRKGRIVVICDAAVIRLFLQIAYFGPRGGLDLNQRGRNTLNMDLRA